MKYWYAMIMINNFNDLLIQNLNDYKKNDYENPYLL